MNKSKGHVEFIDGYEYYKINDQLFRAEIAKALVDGTRPGQFVTFGGGIEFALRLARLRAGKAER